MNTRILLLLAAMGLPALEAQQRTSGFVPTAGGIQLYYEKIGAGPQVIIMPLGFILQPDFERLASPGRTLIFYDQRNRGRSGADPRATLAAEVADMEALRAHLKVERFSAIGYSYLGLMTILYTLEHPSRVERVVQIGPVPMKFGTEYPPEHRNQDSLESLVSKAAVEEVLRLRQEGFHEKEPRAYCEKEWKVTRYRLVGDPAHVEKLGPGHCQFENEWPIRAGKFWAEVRMKEMQNLVVPRDRIAALKQPVLTIHGAKDRNAPYGSGREWAATLGNARLLTVPGAAHQCWVEAPGLVLGAIDTFFKGNWPKQAAKLAK
ncbi:MAG: alpha/beta hydrolase [Bryobacteraceae bacterium]|nr:alpha/beta hydrolase [Bryobacteraceae bacterium]